MEVGQVMRGIYNSLIHCLIWSIVVWSARLGPVNLYAVPFVLDLAKQVDLQHSREQD